MQPDRFEWPNRLRWWDIAWVLFSLANLYAMLLWPDWETVPFHFIWVSLTILYGFRVWKARPTTVILAFVMVLTGTLIWIDVARGVTSLDELTEVPLMAAMFVAMVWHARRRLTAMEETERVSLANLRLLERERRFVQDASHELRTPITVALGHAELIQRIAERSYPRRGCRRHRRRADAPASPRQSPPPARRSGGPRVPPPRSRSTWRRSWSTPSVAGPRRRGVGFSEVPRRRP